VFRKVRGILNKLTPEKFDKLSLELLNVGIDSQTILKGIILLIFEKALDEPKYSSLYAQLCHRLFRDAPNFEPPDSNITTFRRLLLSKCQDEFENRSRATEAFEKDGPLTPEEAEQCCIAKAKMLGNIKFIGELGKLEMLQEGILHKCIKQLVERKKVPAPGAGGSTAAARVADMSEDMECLCEILRTVGQRLDHDRARAWMDQYFERIRAYQANTELPARIRFLLQDIIELRANNWQPRKLQIAEGAPKTIQQVRAEVAKESGIFIPKPAMLSPSYMMTDPFFGPPPPPRGAAHNGHMSAASADMFSAMPSMYLGGIGTGPGVIQIDHFAKANQQINRQRAMGNMGGQGFDSVGSRRQDGGGSGLSKGEMFYRDRRDFGEGGTGGKQTHSDEDDRPHQKSSWGGGGGRQPHHGDDHVAGHQQQRDGGNRGERPNDKQFHKAAQQASRELPPRFQRKQQQMQQKDPSFPSEDITRSHSPSNFTSTASSTPPSSGGHLHAPPAVPLIPFQPVSGSYAPMMPPTLLGAPVPSVSGVAPKSTQSGDDVSLRPVRNFAPLLKPNTPATLPKSALSSNPQSGFRMQPPAPTIGPGTAPLVQKQITVIQVPSLDKNKDKNNKANAGASHEELRQSLENLLKCLLETGCVDEAVKSVMQMKPPKKFVPELLNYLMMQSMDKTDNDRDNVILVIGALKDKNIASSENFMEAFNGVLENMASLEQENPLAKSYVAKFAAGAVANGVVSIAELASPMTGGHFYPLFLLCLQQLAKLKERDWLAKAFCDSKVSLHNMLPELELNKNRMMEILEDRGLGFLMPLLRVQSEMTKQLKADPNPTTFYKWVRDNVDCKLFSDTGFITVLVTIIVHHITSSTTMQEGADTTVTPDKALAEQEKELVEKFKVVLQKFLLDKIPLHVTAIYALQVYSFNNSSPKGLLLRMFMNLYNFEIVDEEAFIKWKEEVNDVHPGKGQALFQVNQWLTWLEQAEEESDDED
jgi:translation initiation factor 4G